MKILLIITILLVISGLERAKAQEVPPDTVWVRWTHDITRLEFSNDDSKILTVGSGSGPIIIFDTETGTQQKILGGNGGYSDDGTLIYSSHLNEIDHYIELFNAENYESIKLIQLPEIKGNYGITLSHDGKLIAAVGYNDLYFIETETGLIKKHITQFGDELRPIRIASYLFSMDGQHLILTMGDPTKGEYGSMVFINTETFQTDYQINNRPKKLAISEDGTMLAFTSFDSDKAVSIMNMQTHEIINSIPGNAGMVCGMTFSPDGNYIALSTAVSNPYLITYIYKVLDGLLYKTINYTQCFPAIDINFNNLYIAGGGGQKLTLFNFITTGIQEPNENFQTLFPNPTNNSLTVNFNLSIPSQLNFNLYDMIGNQISNLKSDFYNSGQITEDVSLGNLSNGSYFLKIESLQFNKTFKITINK